MARSASVTVRATVAGSAAWRRPTRQGRPSGWRPSARTSPMSRSTSAHAGVLEQHRNAVGDAALGDAVQRERHARPGEADFGRFDRDGAVIHKSLRLGAVGLGGPQRVGARPREVFGIEAPERLHGDIEGALRPLRIRTRLGQERDQLQRRCREPAVLVEAGERALRPVEAEHVLQPVDLGDAARDQAACAGGVRVGEDDLGRRPQCDAGPAVQRRCLGAGADRRKRQAGRRCGNGDEAAPGRRPAGHHAH